MRSASVKRILSRQMCGTYAEPAGVLLVGEPLEEPEPEEDEPDDDERAGAEVCEVIEGD